MTPMSPSVIGLRLRLRCEIYRQFPETFYHIANQERSKENVERNYCFTSILRNFRRNSV